MAGETIQVAASDGSGRFNCYLSKPQGGKADKPVPAIVLCQEMLGVTTWLKGMADRLAAAGFLVIAPDIFWRMHPGFIGDHANEADYKQAWKYLDSLDYDKAVEDVSACADALKKMPECNGKVAAAGFCMGGTIAYLSAARLPIDAAIAYYGTSIHKYVNEGGKITCPMMMHLGDHDHTQKPEYVQEIYSNLIGIPNISVWHYDTGHAFANSDLPTLYSKEHAEKAHERTLKLLEGLR